MDAQQIRLDRSIAVATKVMEASPAERLRMLTYLAGMVPVAVEQAIKYVREGM
jgi:hypothetical protein